jgi:Ni/Co efflux regulator RcnB
MDEVRRCWTAAKQRAEKRRNRWKNERKHPSGPKGHVDFIALTARLEHFHEWYKGTNLPSGAKAHDSIALFGTTQVVP